MSLQILTGSNGKLNTIHIYGESDAGKTTYPTAAAYLYMKIGAYTPDGGNFPFNGKYIGVSSPARAFHLKFDWISYII